MPCTGRPLLRSHACGALSAFRRPVAALPHRAELPLCHALRPHLVERVGGLDGLHVDVGALGGAALVRVAGVKRTGVVSGDRRRQLIKQRLDDIVVDQLDLQAAQLVCDERQGAYRMRGVCALGAHSSAGPSALPPLSAPGLDTCQHSPLATDVAPLGFQCRLPC